MGSRWPLRLRYIPKTVDFRRIIPDKFWTIISENFRRELRKIMSENLRRRFCLKTWGEDSAQKLAEDSAPKLAPKFSPKIPKILIPNLTGERRRKSCIAPPPKLGENLGERENQERGRVQPP